MESCSKTFIDILLRYHEIFKKTTNTVMLFKYIYEQQLKMKILMKISKGIENFENFMKFYFIESFMPHLSYVT